MIITGCEFLRNIPDSVGDLESLRELVLSGDGITELPESIGKLGNLTKLNVSHNQLSRLPATIGDLDRLEVLDACGNGDLEGEILGEFGGLQSLKSLNLSRTGICGLPSSMVQLSRLESLDLRDCQEFQELPDLPTCLTHLLISLPSLKAVPDLSSSTNLPKLKDLTVELSSMPPSDSFGEFIHIDPSTSNLECMNSLEMINHGWSPADISPSKSRLHLPSSICNLKALSRLVIVGFKLKQLPENIGELKGLKIMEITNAEFIRNLPNSFGDLESLCNLHLKGDGITELPQSIGKLRNLTELNVRNNRLRRLPAAIGDLDRLEVLVASDNRDLQGEIPVEFSKLQSLTYLDLSWTGIFGLPSSMVQLSKLESLYLESCNKIQELPELPTSLTGLKISCRSLKGVPSLSSLTNLVHLSLLNCGNHDDDGHPWNNHQVLTGNIPAWIHHLQKQEPCLCTRLMDLHLSCPNLSLVSLPSGLMSLSLHHSMSLSWWEHHSNLEGLSRLSLYKSVASEIRLVDLESLKNLISLEIKECEFLERVNDVSRLQKLRYLHFYKCPKLVEIGGLTQPPESLRYLEIQNCYSIRCLPRLSYTQSSSQLHLIVEKCSKLLDFSGPYVRF